MSIREHLILYLHHRYRYFAGNTEERLDAITL